MSSIMRWRSGLMGLSDIAKAPVSHRVEPHDFETGPGPRVVLQISPSSSRTRPPLPRERFSPWVNSGRPVATRAYFYGHGFKPPFKDGVASVLGPATDNNGVCRREHTIGMVGQPACGRGSGH